MNPILWTDAYNLSHYFLKKNVDWEISLLFNRSKPMILFGFADVVRNLTKIEFDHKMVDDAIRCAEDMGMPFPEKMWRNVVTECDGKLPLKIEAVMDGTLVPKNTPFAKIKNTKEGYGELVTWF